MIERPLGACDRTRSLLLRPVAQQLAHSIGTSVSDTTAEIRIVTASVIANSRNSRPTTSPMKRSGISTAISDTVSETMVKPICARALERGLERRLAGFDVARNVLDHHDGVVDDEARRDGQRHQREIVEAEASRYMAAKVPTSESGTDRLGMMVAGIVAQEHEDHEHDEHDGEASSNSTSRTEARIVTVRSVRTATSSAAGSAAVICGNIALMLSTTCDDVGARLALHIQDDRGRGVRPGGEFGVLGAARRCWPCPRA